MMSELQQHPIKQINSARRDINSLTASQLEVVLRKALDEWEKNPELFLNCGYNHTGLDI